MTTELTVLATRRAIYHARVHGTRLVAGAYHPRGDGLHVEVGLALLQGDDADLSLLQLKRHWGFKKEKEMKDLRGQFDSKMRLSRTGNDYLCIPREPYLLKMTRLVWHQNFQ